MKKIALLIAITLLIVAGCVNPRAHTESSDLQITLQTPEHAMTGPADLKINVADASGNPVDSATVDVIGDMSHAGMKEVYASTTNMGGGEYVTDDFQFTMAGDWIMTVEATGADGTKSTKTFQIDGVAAGEGAMGMDDGSMASGGHDDTMEHMDDMDLQHGDEDEIPMEIPAGDPIPTIALSSSDDINFQVTTDFQLTDEEGPYEPMKGHIHVFVDGEEEMMIYEDHFTLDYLSPGMHEVSVALAATDHSPLLHNGKPIEASMMVG